MTVQATKQCVGDLVVKGGITFVIASVDTRMTTYKSGHDDQLIRTEGYTLGLRLALPWDSPFAVQTRFHPVYSGHYTEDTTG